MHSRKLSRFVSTSRETAPRTTPCIVILRSAILCFAILGLGGCQQESDAIDSQSPVSNEAASTRPTNQPTPQVADSAEMPAKQAIELEPLPEPEGDGGTFSISQIMEFGHDNKLYRELLKSPVDPAAGERMILLYTDLPKQTPPKGDVEDWQKRATSLLDAAKSAIAGQDGSEAALKRAVNCNSCHQRFRT